MAKLEKKASYDTENSEKVSRVVYASKNETKKNVAVEEEPDDKGGAEFKYCMETLLKHALSSK